MDESIPEKLTETMELVAQVDPTKRFQNRTGAVFIVVDNFTTAGVNRLLQG